MTICPQYRLRLFLSADLSGSTAYKAGPAARRQGSDPQPRWVTKIREFYREFPGLVRDHFRRERERAAQGTIPEHVQEPLIWKTIGDEIVLVTRVRSHEHVCCCIQAFTAALRDYGLNLERDGEGLDVKGAAWIAAFPAPNVTVFLDPAHPTSTQSSEEDEALAEESPQKADFLGTAIDTGFRVATRATPDQCSLSVELAYLVASGAQTKMISDALHYHGRHALRGVLAGRPYPSVSIDVERDQKRIALRRAEWRLVKSPAADPHDLALYLSDYLEEAKIERPLLREAPAPLHEHPHSYQAFVASWNYDRESEQQRSEAEQTAMSATDDPSDPAAIEDAEGMMMDTLHGLPKTD